MQWVLKVFVAAGLLAGLTIGGPASAAVAVKADAPPDRLGQCAVALNRFKALTKAQGGTPPTEIVERLEAVMAFSKTHTGEWSQSFSTALRAQVSRYDAMSSADWVAALPRDVYACEPYFDADTQMDNPG